MDEIARLHHDHTAKNEGSRLMSKANSGNDIPDQTKEQLSNVLRDIGREVAGAQSKLEQQIREATSELNQLGGLLETRLRASAHETETRDTQSNEGTDSPSPQQYRDRIDELEQQVAYWKARANALEESVSAARPDTEDNRA